MSYAIQKPHPAPEIPHIREVGDGEDVRTFEVFGNSMLPVYRHGDRLVVSATAPIKTGDRILILTSAGTIVGGTLVHRSDLELVMVAFGVRRVGLVVASGDIHFVGRIIWASQ